MTRFDVVIVGARCAGSPLALMLARRGLRVCLVDRAKFPSETPSTHLIQPCGVQLLDRLGVLDAVLAAGAVGRRAGGGGGGAVALASSSASRDHSNRAVIDTAWSGTSVIVGSAGSDGSDHPRKV